MLYVKGEGRYEKEYGALWKALVPASGQAETVQGELVRVVGRLASEYYRNGNINWDKGFRSYTNFLLKHLRDSKVFNAETIEEIKKDIAEVRDLGTGKAYWTLDRDDEDAFDRLTDRVVEWCQHYFELIPHEQNPKLRR